MNEKINQIAEHCDFYVGNEHYDKSYEEKQRLFMEKFAELIVQECSKVVVNGGYRNPALGEKHPLTPPEIARMIQEHFGVQV